MRGLAARLFRRYDALLLPTAPFCPALAELAADPVGPNSRLGAYTNFVNLCDLAADRLHRAAASTVSATRRPLPPPSAPEPAGPDETALFCVGGHMAGLPLNGQIVELGGRFLRAATTQPLYCLHTLGNRPDLVRGGEERIAGEVWALPTRGIGALLACVPAPLGFGTVLLDDGTCLGFLTEAEGITGTPDITALGGWRAYLAQQGVA